MKVYRRKAKEIAPYDTADPGIPEHQAEAVDRTLGDPTCLAACPPCPVYKMRPPPSCPMLTTLLEHRNQDICPHSPQAHHPPQSESRLKIPDGLSTIWATPWHPQCLTGEPGFAEGKQGRGGCGRLELLPTICLLLCAPGNSIFLEPQFPCPKLSFSSASSISSLSSQDL